MSGEYVLILAGNTLERERIAAVLFREGYRVFDTDDVQGARRIMERFPVDVVVVDRGFRPDDVLAFLAHVQARHRGVGRVLMTHEPQSPGALRAMGQGQVHTLLLKPLTETELLLGVGRALRKARVRPALPRRDDGEGEGEGRAGGRGISALVRFFQRVHLGRT
jgi:DNA-binding NtrC family response regulator